MLEGTHCPPICPGHEVLYASAKRAIDVDIGFVSAMYSITKGCHSHETAAAFVCSDTQKSATLYLIRRSFVSPFLFLKDSWHQRTITINGKEHFLHCAEGETDFLFALMRPVKALRLVRDQKVFSPRGELLPFYTLVISTGERNAFGEEALSVAALDPYDGKKDFHYGRDLFCRGTVRTCYHMICMDDNCGTYTYNMNSRSTEQWALKIHRYSSRHESWLDDSWQQFRKQLAAEQLVQCDSMRTRLMDYGYGSGNESIFNEMEVMAYIDGRIAVQSTRTSADQSTTSWMDPWHPHFVPLRATGICFDNIYLATKLYPLGSVHDYMRRQRWSRLEEGAVRVIVRHVLLSLRFLHSHGICHRDISPHNIVLEQMMMMQQCQQQQQQSMDSSFPHNMRFVLMDMGHTAFHSYDRELRPDSRPQCRYSSDQGSSLSSHRSKGAFGMLKRPTSRTSPGKVHYHCPELPRADTYCGFAVDVWQIGVLMFALLFGHGPFDAEVPGQLLLRKSQWFRTVEEKKLLKAKLVSHSNSNSKDEGGHRSHCCMVSIEESGLLTDDCMNFLDRVLQSDPAQRMKVDEALRHRWIQLAVGHETSDR